MTWWIILTIVISAAAVLVSAPVLRGLMKRAPTATDELDAYREQLKALERMAAEGSMAAEQAKTARRAVTRRMLLEKYAARTTSTHSSLTETRLAVIAVAGLAVLGTVTLDMLTARPELPQAAASSAGTSAVNAIEQLAALTRGQTFPDQSQSGLASVDEMIERLIQRLQRDPNDPEGWRMLGWSYFATDQFSDAAEAYAKAIKLSPTVAALRSLHGEALVSAANGVVTSEAGKSFEEALRLDAKDPRARVFAALAKAQPGDERSALDDWIAVLNEGDPSDPWMSDLRQKAIELGRKIGVDVASRVQRSPTPVLPVAAPGPTPDRPPASAGSRGPSAEDVRNAAAMPPEQRMAMIEDMVEGLARRLEQQPRDSEGWIKLIRSRLVLGQTEAAKRALERALETFGDMPQERERIAAAGRDLGLLP